MMRIARSCFCLLTTKSFWGFGCSAERGHRVRDGLRGRRFSAGLGGRPSFFCFAGFLGGEGLNFLALRRVVFEKALLEWRRFFCFKAGVFFAFLRRGQTA